MGTVHQLVRSISPVGEDLSDHQLLEAFLYRQDDRAFAELVRRYGPMVFGVCTRILRHGQDAEDAFQATFLVLIRKAGSILHRDYLGSWLHSVAQRTAQEARRTRTRRRQQESQVDVVPVNPVVPESALEQAELLEALDRELDKLPEKYRAAILLCDVQRKTRKEAASQLDIPEGTLSARLTRGREQLAQRLKRQGFALGVTGCAAVWSETSTAFSVGPLVSRSCSIALTSGCHSQVVQTLVQGVLWKMKLNKVILTVVSLVVFAVGVGGYVFQNQTKAATEASNNSAPPQKKEPKSPPQIESSSPEERPQPLKVIPPAKKPRPVQRSIAFQEKAAALELLKEHIPTKGLQEGLRLSDVLEVFQTYLQQRGRDIPILVDTPAFQKANPKADDFRESTVRFPRFPEKMQIGDALRYALKQTRPHEATYLFRNGTIVVTTKSEASVETLLHRKPVATFSDVPLATALEELEYKTGASITIDPRIGEKGNTKITASFTNNVSLEAILVMLTEMADLKMVRLGSGIFITTPEKATKLKSTIKALRRSAKRRKLIEQKEAKAQKEAEKNAKDGLGGF